MTAPAAVSRSLSEGGSTPARVSALAFMGNDKFARVLAICAAGEITADKLPFMLDYPILLLALLSIKFVHQE